MHTTMKFAKVGAMVLALASSSACASGAAGGLGSILGSVLGGGQQQQQQGGQVSGQVSGIDTRNRQLGLRQQNGQTVTVYYDQNTQVVYQNQSYPVTALENGDQVTMRIQQANNGGYYTDYVQVDQSVRDGNNGRGVYQNGNVQSLEGSVRGVNRQQGYFTLNLQNGSVVNVQLSQQVSRNDLNRFNNLRQGEYVRFYGVVQGNNNVELRQFQ